MAALSTSSVTMMGLKAPVVGVKQTRSVKTAAMPRANLSSTFTVGSGKSMEGQRLSLGVAASTASTGRRSTRCVTTMAAKIAGYIKLAIEAGKANPAPPIGPALGAKVSLRYLLFRGGRGRQRRRRHSFHHLFSFSFGSYLFFFSHALAAEKKAQTHGGAEGVLAAPAQRKPFESWESASIGGFTTRCAVHGCVSTGYASSEGDAVGGGDVAFTRHPLHWVVAALTLNL